MGKLSTEHYECVMLPSELLFVVGKLSVGH